MFNFRVTVRFDSRFFLFIFLSSYSTEAFAILRLEYSTITGLIHEILYSNFISKDGLDINGAICISLV